MKVSALDSALAGIQKAQEMVNKAAESIANPEEILDEGKLIRDIVDLKMGKILWEANLVVLKNDEEMKQKVIDILA